MELLEVVNLEQLQSQRRNAQASFEFVIVLSITLLLVTAFTISIADECTDTFVLSAVKNTIESEASKLALQTPGCENTAMREMAFSKDTHTITFAMNDCQIDVSKVAGIVETTLCGVKEQSGTDTFICSGTKYKLIGV